MESTVIIGLFFRECQFDLIKILIKIASNLQNPYHFCSRNPDQTLFQKHSFRLFLQKTTTIYKPYSTAKH